MTARQLAISAGTPVVPGTTEPLEDAAEAERVALEFGYPVLLKAAAGGGGKGMRVVREAAELRSALDAARREAKGAFGDDAIYVEKYVVRPRHVEIQVLADAYGDIVHLGERDCSVQRRHQKMIEEAPSIAVDASLRARMGAAAVAAARAAGYVNAGTCEFLLDADDHFYFLEMNTRIQVEHPVTELVTGVDLVQWQLRVAGGDRLAFRQEDIEHRGWAIECRITSEDADDGFLPSTGTVSYLHVPTGPGIRWDGGIETGTGVGLFYDPMVGKLIVWAPTRIEAVARMHRALLELSVAGIETSRNFHLRVMENDDFRSGDIDIQWLERSLPALVDAPVPVEATRIAAITAALMAERDRSAPRQLHAGQSGGAGSEWVRVGRFEALR
jgi:acetyl-CoA carboxylase biotin carboxylase subunit